MKLIDKDVLTEKLWERRIKHREFGGSPHSEYGHEDDEILSLIDTLEVKEVDFDAEWERYFEHRGEMATVNVKHLAKYFFELGLKVAQKGD